MELIHKKQKASILIDAAFYSILAFAFVSSFAYTTGFYPVSWDESVYIRSAEFFASGGDRSFVENLRPLGFPLFLAPFQFFSEKLFLMRLASISLAALAIIFLKKDFEIILGFIDKESSIFNDAVASASALLILSFPFFFKASIGVDPEIFAMFLYSLSSFFILSRMKSLNESKNKADGFDLRILLAGVLLGFAFYSRFIYGIYIFASIVFLVFLASRKPCLKSTIKAIRDKRLGSFLIGLFLVLIIFSAIHYKIYSSELEIQEFSPALSGIYPVVNQFLNHAQSERIWMTEQRFDYYLQGLLFLASASLFFMPGILLMIWKNIIHPKKTGKDCSDDNLAKNAIVLFALMSILLPMAFLFSTIHKEFRYILTVLPWIMFFAAYFFGWIVRHLWYRHRLAGASALISSLLLFSSVLADSHEEDKLYAESLREQDKAEHEFYRSLENMTSDIITTTPLAKTGGKTAIGYYGEKYFLKKLDEKIYDYVFYSGNAFPCRKDDPECHAIKKTILDRLYQDYEEYEKFDDDLIIYKKKQVYSSRY